MGRSTHPVTRLVRLDDAGALARLLRDNRDNLAPYEPHRADSYFTEEGHAAVIADQARSDPETRITLEMIEANSSYEARAALIRKFVRQDPARAALVVRDLIRTDAKAGA